MMSIFIARHLISIIAQIAKKAMKVPQKKTALKVQQKIQDGQKKFCAWCIGNFLVGDTSSLEAKQKFR